MKKIVVEMEISCSKCKQKAMKIAAKIDGVQSIEVDESKNTVTVTGETDPVKVTSKLRKFKKHAKIVSVGPPPQEEEKKKENEDAYLPGSCRSCDVWYVVDGNVYSNLCSIM